MEGWEEKIVCVQVYVCKNVVGVGDSDFHSRKAIDNA